MTAITPTRGRVNATATIQSDPLRVALQKTTTELTSVLTAIHGDGTFDVLSISAAIKQATLALRMTESPEGIDIPDAYRSAYAAWLACRELDATEGGRGWVELNRFPAAAADLKMGDGVFWTYATFPGRIYLTSLKRVAQWARRVTQEGGAS